MNKKFLLTVFMLFAFVGTGCTSQTDSIENQTFEFASGGAYHLEGFGEWQVTLESAGRFSINHNVRDEITDYGTFILTEQENLEIWALIRAANIKSLKSSERSGMPDEVAYTFSLNSKTQNHTADIWTNDARQNDKIVALIEGIAALIEVYTQQSPILK